MPYGASPAVFEKFQSKSWFTSCKLNRVSKWAKAQGAKVRDIPLAAALHSSYMKAVVSELNEEFSRTYVRDPDIPLVANTSAIPLYSGKDIREEINSFFVNTVLWKPSIDKIVQEGVSRFVEIGSERILSPLVKRISDTASAELSNLMLSEDANAILSQPITLQIASRGWTPHRL